MKYNTKCEKCVFQKKKKNFQCGCLAQDTSSFNIDTDDQGNYILLDRVCQYKRTSLKGQSVENCLKKTREEVGFNCAMFTVVDKPCDAIDIYNSVYNAHSAIKPKKLVVFVGHYEGVNDEIPLAVRGREQLTICVVDKGQLENTPGIVMAQETGCNHYVFIDSEIIKDIYTQFFEWLDIQINDNGFRFRVLFGEDAFLIPKIVYDNSVVSAQDILKSAQSHPQCISFKRLYERFVNFEEWDSIKGRFV